MNEAPILVSRLPFDVTLKTVKVLLPAKRRSSASCGFRWVEFDSADRPLNWPGHLGAIGAETVLDFTENEKRHSAADGTLLSLRESDEFESVVRPLLGCVECSKTEVECTSVDQPFETFSRVVGVQEVPWPNKPPRKLEIWLMATSGSSGCAVNGVLIRIIIHWDIGNRRLISLSDKWVW